MVQGDIIQIDVAFLTYNSSRSCENPLVDNDSTCVAGLYELKKHKELKRRQKDTMGTEAYHHYKWYNTMLVHELKGAIDNTKLKIIHWHVESGNKEAFMMNGTLYKAVSIIIGPSMEHWYCANSGKTPVHSYGSRFRNGNTSSVQQELNTLKMANCKLEEDQEVLLYITNHAGQIVSKCTSLVCANNCYECSKHKSPYTDTNNKSKCVCHCPQDYTKVESDFEDSDDEDEDIALSSPINYTKNIVQSKKTLLNSIYEE